FVSNRLGAMAEVVQEGRDGLLAEPFSEQSLATQIQKLISAPDTCASMGESGRGRILNEFNRNLWMKKIHPVFQKALSRPL
ncbi:hypothetical protein EBX31_14730, partial [bacterium]|nr:hypothetical protein [bacterium]